jgi:hypothetical protein
VSSSCAIELSREETVLFLTCRPQLGAEDDARLVSLLQAPMAWERIVWRAESLRTVPLLWHHINRLEAAAALAPEIAGYLDAWSRLSRVRSKLILDELSALTRAFSHAGVSYFLLKGSALAPTLYPDPLLRPMFDIDMMVQPDDVAHARSLLTDRGFMHAFWDADTNAVVPVADEQLVEYHTDHYELPVFMRLAHTHVDVPATLIPRTWRRKHLKCYVGPHSTASFPLFVDIHVNLSLHFELEDVWNDVKYANVFGHQTPVQSPTGMVWFLAARLYNEAFQLNTCKLSMLGDLHAILSHWGSLIDWDWLASTTTKYGMQAAIYYVLAQLRNMGADVPEELLARLQPDRLGFPSAHDWGDVMPKLLSRVVVHDIMLAQD